MNILRYWSPKYPLVTMEPCTVLLLNIDTSAEQRRRRWWGWWELYLAAFPCDNTTLAVAVVPTLAVVPTFHTRHEAVPGQVQVHAHGPVHLPHRGSPHQHLLWTLPFRERHSACDICVSTPQCYRTIKIHLIEAIQSFMDFCTTTFVNCFAEQWTVDIWFPFYFTECNFIKYFRSFPTTLDLDTLLLAWLIIQYLVLQRAGRVPGVLPHHRLSLLLLHLRVPGQQCQHQHSQLTTSFTILHCDECVQAGLVGLLVARYKLPILVSVAYLSLSISYHVASLNTRWYQPQSYWWTDQLLALFVVHRSGGVHHPAVFLPVSLCVLGFQIWSSGKGQARIGKGWPFP